MTDPVRPGFGTQPLGTTPFGWPPRDIAVSPGGLAARTLAAALRVRKLIARLEG